MEPEASNLTRSRPTSDESALVRLRREDLAALTQGYWRDSRTWRAWAPVVVGIAALALSAVLIAVAEQRHWPGYLEPSFLAGGWAVMLGMAGLSWRRERRLRDEYRFVCPECDAPLLDGIRDAVGLARVEMVIATGVCPKCGVQILAP